MHEDASLRPDPESGAPVALGFFEKLRVLAACAIASVLLWTLGWQVAHPTDPQMAITLSLSGASALAVWPALAALAAVCAAVGTAIIGRRLPDAGLFAAAIGLAAMAQRGGTMQVLLGYHAGTQTDSRRTLMMGAAMDCILWAGVMAVAWVTVALVRRWLWPDAAATGAPAAMTAQPPAGAKSAAARKATAEQGVNQAVDYLALAVTIAVALIVIWNTISRTPVAMVARAQTIASVAGGLFLGAMAARYFTGSTRTLWYVLAAPAVGVIAFVLGYLSADMAWAQGTPYQPYAALATTPPHDLARSLPVVYVTVGVAGALGGYWTADRMERMAQQESS